MKKYIRTIKLISRFHREDNVIEKSRRSSHQSDGRSRARAECVFVCPTVAVLGTVTPLKYIVFTH